MVKESSRNYSQMWISKTNIICVRLIPLTLLVFWRKRFIISMRISKWQKRQTSKSINFSVPTGNFGDIFAGYLAKKMGLPVGKLIVATNENNILERFIQDGVYKPGEFRSTYSPSMDIQVASNFERYLYYLLDENPSAVSALMDQFKSEGKIVVNEEQLRQVKEDFAAHGVEGEECLQTISKYYAETNYLLRSAYCLWGRCIRNIVMILVRYVSHLQQLIQQNSMNPLNFVISNRHSLNKLVNCLINHNI